MSSSIKTQKALGRVINTAFLAEPEPKIFGLSGGPDSLALLAYLARKQKYFPSGGAIIPVIVDHGYRHGSAEEANQVAEWAKIMGFAPLIKRRNKPLPSGNLQAFFREIRKEALFEAALEKRAKRLITAHHQDDQIETFVMRRNKGSGKLGLACMAFETPWRHLLITRPALDCSRYQLHKALHQLPFQPVNDPSNTNRQFERVRIRQRLAQEPDAVRQSLLTELAETRYDYNLVMQQIDAVKTSAITFPRLGTISLDIKAVQTLPDDGKTWLVNQILRACGGQERPQRRDAIIRLCRHFETEAVGSKHPQRRTLGGVEVSGGGHSMHFRREKGRMKPTPTIHAVNHQVWWDNRYLIDFKSFNETDKLVSDADANPKLIRPDGQTHPLFKDKHTLQPSAYINRFLWPGGAHLGWAGL